MKHFLQNKSLIYLGISFWVLLLIFVAYLSIQLYYAPAHTVNRLALHTVSNQDFLVSSQSDETLDSLARVIAFKQACLELAKKDSIQLILDLSINNVILTIKGVPLLTTRLVSIDNDDLLKQLSLNQYTGLFGQPLFIDTLLSTIIKEPIVEKQAPKTPEEAAANVYMPDTLIQQPAFLELILANGIHIRLDQSVNETDVDKRMKRSVERNRKISLFQSHIDHLVAFESIHYQPTISATLTVKDLRAVYRALPRHPYVVIRY